MTRDRTGWLAAGALLLAVGCGGGGSDSLIQGPPPPPGTILFSSDWSTSTGTSDNALLDGGKQNPWSSRWGGNGSLTVVSASGLGFPAGMTNVLRVTQYQQDFDWVMANNRWSLPEIGHALAFRVYLRNTVADSEGDKGTVYSSHHPIESTGSAGSTGGGYYVWHIGSYNDGTFPILFSMNNPAYPLNGWTFGAPQYSHGGRDYDPAPLDKNTTYRLEWKFTRTGTNRYSLSMRVYDQAGTQLYDDSSTYAWTGNGETLASSGTNLNVDDRQMVDIRIGTNGGGWTFNAPQYIYWGGFAVCADDWCGPYTTS
ncbi:MAG TPA: hypothetical protein VG817_05725 [Gemmatimonadales bacterium]|nr:hypothetical protein [Gemmatimonadales bacterium]